ncbi:MAG: hypothetical protein ABSF27_04170 [Candidatus Dormibacteria bacterium]
MSPDPSNSRLRFADNLDGEEVVALGLPAARLLLAGGGAAGVWALTELPVPEPLRLGAAGLLALITASLAWGRVQGVSLARWSWLAAGYASRRLTVDGGRRGNWFRAEADPTRARSDPLTRRRPPCVAFASLSGGSDCSAILQAVALRLSARPMVAGRCRHGLLSTTDWAVPAALAGPERGLRLCDWGRTTLPPPPCPGMSALVLVWDGENPDPPRLADRIAPLRRAYPAAQLMVSLTRAGPAAGLAELAAGAGARLVGAVPTDGGLGQLQQLARETGVGPSEEGVRAVALAVAAAAGCG